MLIKIFHDVFDICDRIKEIDDGYFIVFNTSSNQYEIHNFKQKVTTFCISCPNGLDSRVITKLRKTRVENIDKVLKEIEESNKKIEENIKNKQKDESEYKLREMFDYANKKEYDIDFSDSNKTKWA